MPEFPRTTVGGASLSRLIIGTNWFLGYSHTSSAKDRFITSYQDRSSIADILVVFLEHGVDTLIGPPSELLHQAIQEAQERSGQEIISIITPSFNVLPGGDPQMEPERALDYCVELGASFCLPHQCVTDVLLDRMHQEIRGIDRYTAMIRQRGMIPGLSTHSPDTVVIADQSGADIETYLQIYNALGFLMHIEVDWAMRIIKQARLPVITIKPLAAGRLLPVVGLTHVWNTIRDQDMVAIGTTTPDEARQVIDISLDILNRRIPDYNLGITRSKQSLIHQDPL
jgi:hypothetical protein